MLCSECECLLNEYAQIASLFANACNRLALTPGTDRVEYLRANGAAEQARIASAEARRKFVQHKGSHEGDSSWMAGNDPTRSSPHFRRGTQANFVRPREEILGILIREVNSAKARLADAKTTVDALIAADHVQLPQPDGLHQLKNAVTFETAAREALLLAIQRHSGFVFGEIIPEDLV